MSLFKKTLKILIVEDHAMFRGSLERTFRSEFGIRYIGEAANGLEAIAMCEKEHWDIMLLDIRMPEMDGHKVLAALKAKNPPYVIVISSFNDKYNVSMTYAAGARGFVLKECNIEELGLAMKEVLAGNCYFTKAITKHLSEDERMNFTLQELRVLRLLCQEKSSQEIADELGISKHTVDDHRKTLLEKSGCHNTVGLGIFAVQNKLVDTDK